MEIDPGFQAMMEEEQRRKLKQKKHKDFLKDLQEESEENLEEE